MLRVCVHIFFAINLYDACSFSEASRYSDKTRSNQTHFDQKWTLDILISFVQVVHNSIEPE